MASRRFFWLSWSMSVRSFLSAGLSADAWLPLPRGSPVHAFECLDEVRHDGAERRRQRRLACNEHVVEVAPGMILAYAPDCRLEAPSDAVALDRLADLPGDREAEPRLLPCGCLAIRLAIALPWPRARRPARPSAHPCGPAKTLPALSVSSSSLVAPFAAVARALAIGHPIAAGRHLTPRGACGPSHAGEPRSCGHRWWPCACGNHAGACARACSADRSVSRPSPLTASPCRGRDNVSAELAARAALARNCRLRSETDRKVPRL